MTFKLKITPEAVTYEGKQLDDETVARIAFASKVVQKLPDGLILETSLKNPGVWRLPIEILSKLY